MKYIREFLNKLQIGYRCRSFTIIIPFNQENWSIVVFFYEKNWIKMWTLNNDKITIYLRYINNKPLFTKIKFISTSGHRQYFTKESLAFFKKNIGGNANILIFTSFGLKDLKFAENLLIGGEIACLLYE